MSRIQSRHDQSPLAGSLVCSNKLHRIPDHDAPDGTNVRSRPRRKIQKRHADRVGQCSFERMQVIRHLFMTAAILWAVACASSATRVKAKDEIPGGQCSWEIHEEREGCAISIGVSDSRRMPPDGEVVTSTC